jgi:purine-binding chemotaxis protein CheW
VIGILNVRGEMLSVVDLRVLLQHGTSQLTDTSRIVVIEARDLVAGFLVDQMVDILEVPIITFRSLLEETDDNTQHYLAGQFHWLDMTLALLDSNLLLQGIVVDQA